MSDKVSNRYLRLGCFLSRFFEVEITIRMFGNVIYSYKFPPEKS